MRVAQFAGAAPAPAAAMRDHADRVFRALAVASLYILIRRWRAGGVSLSVGPAPAEVAAAAALCASVAWLYALPVIRIRRSSTQCRRQD